MKFLQITPSEGNFFEINKNAFSYKNIITSYHIRMQTRRLWISKIFRKLQYALFT